MADEEIVLNLKIPEGFFDDLDRRFADAADKFGGRLRSSGGGGGGGGAGGGAGGGLGAGTASDARGTSLAKTFLGTALGAVGGAAMAVGGAFLNAELAGGRNHPFGAGLTDDGPGGLDLTRQRNEQRAIQGDIDRNQSLANFFGSIGWGSSGFQNRADELRAQNDARFGVKQRVAANLGNVAANYARLGITIDDESLKASGRVGLAIEKKATDAEQHAQRLINTLEVPSSAVRGAGMGQ